MQILAQAVSACRVLLGFALAAPSASAAIVIAKIDKSAQLTSLFHRFGMGNTHVVVSN